LDHHATGAAASVPAGFHPLPPLGETFNTVIGPLYLGLRDGRLVGGLRVEKRHCNPAGSLHGGMSATLADICMSLAVQFDHDLGAGTIVTVSMTVDYLGAGRPGDWVEIHSEIDRAGGTSFTRASILVPREAGDATPIARASAVFRTLRPAHGGKAPPHVGNLLRQQFGLPPFPAKPG
jgi:acyl-coenzyme A thioesterase 13